MSKWNKPYFEDLAERVASSAVGGALAVVVANSTDVIHVSAGVWESFVLIPAAVSLLKGLATNLPADEASASLVGVTSAKTETVAVPAPQPAPVKKAAKKAPAKKRAQP